MLVELKRRTSFSAAHNYWLTSLTQEQNVALFGQWAAQRGHGHNYDIELTVAGEVDLRTGMVVNIVDIDRILKGKVVSKLHNQFLNHDVPYFGDRPPTLENISLFCWEVIEPELPGEAHLVSIQLWEMPTLWATRIRRAGSMEVSITRAYDFAASHKLHSHQLSDEENLALFGKCNNPNGHGHNYGVEVTIAGDPDTRSGMIINIEDLDRVVDEEVLQAFDHKHLNLDTPEFATLNPTSEMLTVVIWNKLAKRLPTSGSHRLSSVVVRETARNSFEYHGT